MKQKQTLSILLVLAVMLGLARTAGAVKIADVTRFAGQQNNVIMGIGLVYGLKGTGDGGDFGPAMRPLREFLEKNDDGTLINELKDVSNVALVTVTVTLPSQGVVRGDAFNVSVMSMGKASSLRGGKLIAPQLSAGTGPKRIVMGSAHGTVTLDDPSTPTAGIVVKGFTAEQSLTPMVIRDNGRMTLIIDDAAASWGLANQIATVISAEEGRDGAPIAVAMDPRTVEIQIPQWERERPDAFIARVQRLQIPLMPQEARVTVNTKTGSILLSGDVEISPSVISYKGLSIQAVVPKAAPSIKAPVVTVQNAVGLQTGDIGSAKLQDLVTAFDQLKVPPEDRINIVRDLYRSGRLHAKLIIDEVAP